MAAIELFSNVINLEEAMIKSEAEEKNMWTERLSSERDNTEEKKDEKDSSSPSPKDEKDSPPPLPEYETPPKTEAEAIFRVLDLERRGFVTRKVKILELHNQERFFPACSFFGFPTFQKNKYGNLRPGL